LRWQALPDWEPLLFGPSGLRLNEWRADGRSQVVEEHPLRTVYSVKLTNRAFYVEYYRSNRFWDIARQLVRPGSARQEWRYVMEIIRRGIPTAGPVAWQEELRRGTVRDRYLVTEALPDAYDDTQRRTRHRGQGTLRTVGDFISVRHHGRRAHAVRDLAAADLERLLKDPDALLQENLDRPVKLDRASLIVEADLPLAQGNTRVFYKRYRPRNWRKALLAKCRPGKALGAWRHGHALLLRRIATARPLAVFDVRRPWYRCQSYLAVEWIEGSRNLHLYAWELAARPAAERMRRARQCAESLGKLIGRLHARCLVHGDLKGSNLLVCPRSDDVQTYLVDVGDVRRADSPTLAQRAADLARLAVSIQAHPWVTRTTCRRFLQAYVAQTPSLKTAWKSLWREVARRSDRLANRKRRRGKPIL
jgi:tRNA A-37 threonylcarbamoyl transferase component Bud32